MSFIDSELLSAGKTCRDMNNLNVQKPLIQFAFLHQFCQANTLYIGFRKEMQHLLYKFLITPCHAYFNDFAHTPWEDTPNFPKAPHRKKFLHKLLVKRPGYLPGMWVRS